MDAISGLIQILEVSVKRNGEIPLTNKHLLNIIKMLKRRLDGGEHISIEEYITELNQDNLWK